MTDAYAGGSSSMCLRLVSHAMSIGWTPASRASATVLPSMYSSNLWYALLPTFLGLWRPRRALGAIGRAFGLRRGGLSLSSLAFGAVAGATLPVWRAHGRGRIQGGHNGLSGSRVLVAIIYIMTMCFARE